jgi:hypothetical protein
MTASSSLISDREPSPASATSSSENAARARLVTPAELAAFLVVDRSYVYEHAHELGAIRLGSGPRARMRFDLEDVKRRLSAATCLGGRESGSGEAASSAGSRGSRRRRTGTNVELLPIRGRSEAA